MLNHRNVLPAKYFERARTKTREPKRKGSFRNKKVAITRDMESMDFIPAGEEEVIIVYI